MSPLSAQDLYLFNEGNHVQLYRHLGAHPDPKGGVCFAVWAPNARAVHVVGSFNQWDGTCHSMTAVERSGIWQLEIDEASPGDLYKFRITTSSGEVLLKSDPFARTAEISPDTASIIWQSTHTWQDSEWMATRGVRQALDAPMSVYEVHLGSWRRHADGAFMSYRELAPLLVEHLQATGFTHVEFLPVMEHPFFGSWGYQCTGYFAPSSRQGSPDDFKYLVDVLHQHGFGVLLDWVPSHFPEDPHGLARFDGTHLYEHADPRKGFHPDWKSCIFNYDRHEVRSFLMSSARFWLDDYHIDGLRVDAVASMLYLDYSRGEGEWIPNEYGGRENLGAITFLKRLNEAMYLDFPDIHMIAEESTAWPQVTRPTSIGGLGFGMKWDMGWMHDTLHYLERDPIHRTHHHNELTFRAMYAWSEQYMLALSHDEVVHGKGSLYRKMHGDAWQKMAHLRLLYGWMYAQPGKKLLFMGSEFAQDSEWNHDAELDWQALEDDSTRQAMLDWVRSLNELYSARQALHRSDFNPDGFQWIEADDADRSVFAFSRKNLEGDGADELVIIANFTPVVRHDYILGVPSHIATWQVLLNSDEEKFGGSGVTPGDLEVMHRETHGHTRALCLTLPPLSILLLGAQRGSRGR